MSSIRTIFLFQDGPNSVKIFGMVESYEVGNSVKIGRLLNIWSRTTGEITELKLIQILGNKFSAKFLM